MPTLSQWLESNGISDAEFGRRIGKSRPTAWRLASGGINSIDRETVQAIFRETGGQVTPNDLLLDGITVEPPRDSADAAGRDGARAAAPPKTEAA